MDTNQKAEALSALCELRIKFRDRAWRCGGPEPWYVEQQVDVKEPPGMLTGLYGNGFTPDEAIEDHWRQLVTELPADKYLVVRSGNAKRRAVRWNGFMWADVHEPEREKAA